MLTRLPVVLWLGLAAVLPAQGKAVPQALRVLELSGSPYQRGFTHGETLRAEIAELVSAWKANLTKTYGTPADEFIAKFIAETTFEKAIAKWTPGLLAEVRGIADGAGLDWETAFAFNLPDEIWAVGRDVAQHCTAIGIHRTGDQPTMVAQNMDIPPFMHGHPTLLRVRPQSGPEALVLTVPGMIGVNGINQQAIGITCNTILQLRPARTGVPVAFVVRGVLAQSNHEDALEFLKSIEHASGQNYTVGGPLEAHAYECSARQVRRFVPYEGARVTWHTNHPLANDDYSPRYLEQLSKAGRSTEQGLYVCHRLAALEKRLAHKDASISLATIKAALSSQDSPAGPINNAHTYACTVMELGAKPRLHVAPGRPDRTPFAVYSFAR